MPKRENYELSTPRQRAFLEHIGYTLKEFFSLPVDSRGIIGIDLEVILSRGDSQLSNWTTRTVEFQVFGRRISGISIKDVAWAEYTIEDCMEEDFSFSAEDYFLTFRGAKDERVPTKEEIASRYTYEIKWSDEDKEFMGTCKEILDISCLCISQSEALAGTYELAVIYLKALEMENE